MGNTRPILPYGRHEIDEDDLAAITGVLRSGWLTTGPMVSAFERAFATNVGARFAVSCSSGTAGLHLAALALGLGAGDSVIVPALTFLATANAARYVGAEVVFADVEAETGLLSDDGIASALDRATDGRVKAVFPVHMNGQCADMARIAAQARADGLAIVEDACHAIGSSYVVEGERVPIGACRHSDLAVFSLHPVKTITMGEGGVVTTNDESLYDRLCRLRSHGIIRDPEQYENTDLAFDARGEPNPWYYEMDQPGFNYRASDIHCALGSSQLGRLDRFVSRRAELVAQYDRRIATLAPLVRPIARVGGCTPAWHLYVVLIDFERAGVDRAAVMNRLREDGIGTQVHYLPLHHQPYYRRRYGALKFPGADSYYARCLSLPLFVDMDEADVTRVVEALHDALSSG